MNAKAFQHFYEYHFTENRKIWDSYIVSLPYEKFIQDGNYSHGSAREQIIHLIDVDDVWVSELQGIEPFEPLPSADFDDRENIRTRLDDVEKKMRNYLAGRSLHWERGLKLDQLSRIPAGTGRSLHWERGLKRRKRRKRTSRQASLPSLGAWIETPFVRFACP